MHICVAQDRLWFDELRFSRGDAACGFHADQAQPLADTGIQNQASILSTMASKRWRVVLKTNGDDTFAYDSPLWTDGNVLHPESNPIAAGNAKYPEFNSQCISGVQACVVAISIEIDEFLH